MGTKVILLGKNLFSMPNLQCGQRQLLFIRCTDKTINSMEDFRCCFILVLFANYFFS